MKTSRAWVMERLAEASIAHLSSDIFTIVHQSCLMLLFVRLVLARLCAVAAREKRTFGDGHDPRWTAMHKNDYTNQALQFYSRDMVRVCEISCSSTMTCR